jgi:hypothetical protein
MSDAKRLPRVLYHRADKNILNGMSPLSTPDFTERVSQPESGPPEAVEAGFKVEMQVIDDCVWCTFGLKTPYCYNIETQSRVIDGELE